MAEWKDFDLNSGIRPADMYGPKWHTTPCVVVTSTGLTFNESAVKAFGLRGETAVRVCFAGEREEIIGFRVLSKHENQIGAAVIRVNGKTKKDVSPSTIICSQVIANKLSEYRGHVCELTLDSGSHVIAALLDSPVHKYVKHNGRRKHDDGEKA